MSVPLAPSAGPAYEAADRLAAGGPYGHGGREKKRKIALEILEEVDKIARLAKMLTDEDDPFARYGVYTFLDAELKALTSLVHELVFSPE